MSMPAYKDVDGFRIPAMFSDEAFRSGLKYKVRDDDLFIVTYPKCGTTWTQQIVFLLLNNGESPSSVAELMTGSPFLEMLGSESAEKMQRPGAIKTHLPFDLTPYNAKAKYIVVVRNPFDACVSFFHHTQNMYGWHDGTFDVYFELFISGQTDYGDYFDHLLSWWPHRNDSNVLFMTFEDMKKDPRTAVNKLAKFIGDKYFDAVTEDDGKLYQAIMEKSSIDYMRNVTTQVPMDPSKLPEVVQQMMKRAIDDNKEIHMEKHFRKGVVDDWKNYMSEEQINRLREKFREKTAGTDIATLWPHNAGWM